MSGSGKGSEALRIRPEDLISLQKAAGLSGLSSGHLRLLVNQGQLWGIKVSRNWVTTEQAVREYMTRDRKPGPKTSKKRT
jgi:hypothetical protein